MRRRISVVGLGYVGLPVAVPERINPGDKKHTFTNLVPSGVISLAAGVNLDVTEDGAVVGIEMLDASKKFPLETLFRCEYEPEMFLSHH